jgi:hypothetical protein
LVSYHVPYNVTCNVLGLVTSEDQRYKRLELVSLTPGSPAERQLANKNVIGYYIISINGVCIRSISDIGLILSDYHDLDDTKRGPAYLTGVTILFGIAQQEAPDPDQMEFSEQDHATARVVWSILASTELESLANDAHEVDAIFLKNEQLTTVDAVETVNPARGGTDPRLAKSEMNHALIPPPDDEILAYVKAIVTSSLYLQTDVPMEDKVAFVQSIMASDLTRSSGIMP